MVSFTSRPELLNRKPSDMPRGLLPVPEPVREQVEEMARTSPVKLLDSYLQQVIRQKTLEYHCGGQFVAYRETPAGMEVLAVGSDEIRDLVQRQRTQKGPDGIVFGQPPLWE